VKERVELYTVCTDHVMIRSECKYLIQGNVVMLKCQVFVDKTGPFPVSRVFCVVKPVATVRLRVEPEPEPTREFGPIAITTLEEPEIGNLDPNIPIDNNCTDDVLHFGMPADSGDYEDEGDESDELNAIPTASR